MLDSRGHLKGIIPVEIKQSFHFKGCYAEGKERKKAEADFFLMLLLLSRNPEREFLKCSSYSISYQKILGLSTCCGQLHKIIVAATDSWV